MTTTFQQTRICGFGDVKFSIRWGDDPYGMAGWNQESYANTIHVPGGNVNETFLMGMGTLNATYRLTLDTVADYRELVALMQTQGTLTLYQRMCELPGREVVWFGEVYTELDDVTLMAVLNPSVRVDGSVDCDASFQMQERPV